MNNTHLKNLLNPAKAGAVELTNKVVMAPLTRSRAEQGDVASNLMATYYSQRSGAGLIITEASQISAQGKGYPRTPGIFTAEQIQGWKKVVDAVHVQGSKIFLQIWHVGRLSHRDAQPSGVLPVAPSAIKPDGSIFTVTGLKELETPRALETSEIAGIVNDFRQAAINAKEAGFDGVEIHAANGYLIEQFIKDGTNQRCDQYGGTIENRARFLKEVVESVVEVYGSDRVGVRISPIFDGFSMSDSNPTETYNYVVDMLNNYDLAYLHVMQLGAGDFDFVALKNRYRGLYIANGGYDANSADEAIQNGETDLVSFGSKFLANPDLVARFRVGAPLNEPDSSTFYQGEEKGYTDYPILQAH
ncbi:alkene reductase [Vibrio alginolyticus]|uniref:alkene reductase n=1 Tax=Vibrio alginolyticus TaxID=663 RepID=UPI003D7D1E16